jgi:hypothetical protein
VKYPLSTVRAMLRSYRCLSCLICHLTTRNVGILFIHHDANSMVVRWEGDSCLMRDKIAHHCAWPVTGHDRLDSPNIRCKSHPRRSVGFTRGVLHGHRNIVVELGVNRHCKCAPRRSLKSLATTRITTLNESWMNLHRDAPASDVRLTVRTGR